MRKLVLALGTIALQGAIGPVRLTAQSGGPQVRNAAPAARTTARPNADAAAPVAGQVTFDTHIGPLLTKYCSGCHGGESPPAGVRLHLANEEAAREIATAEPDFWSRVATEVSTKQMPPASARTSPTDAERTLLVAWITGNMLAVDREPDPGPFMVHRLNNREYANTLRDLLYLPASYDAAADFPPDERGDGFDNNAGTLTISPVLVESYLAAVEKATVAALGLDPKAAPQSKDATLAAKNKLNDPSAALRVDFANRQEKIRLNMETFAPRAFRRPVSKEEIDGLMKFAALSFAHAGESYDQATALAIRAALMSPEFLFRMERDPNPDGTGKVFEITEYQLAARSSYFLWSTMPDDELYVAARDNKLRATLDQQIARMLKDPKSISLTKDFLGQWLEIRGMHAVTNAPKSLLESMQGETEHFFDYIIRNDRSILEFLNADYTFVNEELAKLYGIPGITGEAFQKVQVDRAQRGGIFTQASFLTLTSKPLGDSRRTSPVLRGKWILENIFNQPVPPPPPNVPELKLDTNKELKGTVRQIFEQHRQDPACAGCHARMDPYGFALENYDGYGAWRQQDNHVNVDPSGEINGKRFQTPVEFRAIMAERKDDFRRAVVSKLLSYALGRGIQSYDRPAIDAICAASKAGGDRFSSVVASVVKSYPFQHARGMKGQTANDTSATTWFHPVAAKPAAEPLPSPAQEIPGKKQ
jgi:mono/diheme cytochrome c family protein